MNNVYMTHNNN